VATKNKDTLWLLDHRDEVIKLDVSPSVIVVDMIKDTKD